MAKKIETENEEDQEDDTEKEITEEEGEEPQPIKPKSTKADVPKEDDIPETSKESKAVAKEVGKMVESRIKKNKETTTTKADDDEDQDQEENPEDEEEDESTQTLQQQKTKELTKEQNDKILKDSFKDSFGMGLHQTSNGQVDSGLLRNKVREQQALMAKTDINL